jgi:hypothetical protein
MKFCKEFKKLARAKKLSCPRYIGIPAQISTV